MAGGALAAEHHRLLTEYGAGRRPTTHRQRRPSVSHNSQYAINYEHQYQLDQLES